MERFAAHSPKLKTTALPISAWLSCGVIHHEYRSGARHGTELAGASGANDRLTALHPGRTATGPDRLKRFFSQSRPCSTWRFSFWPSSS